ncbi:MAG: hypothetical protein JXA96_14295 [Sedimentisphaerales bacterium]|nr:hypothetical protein [Sedimentisphaerales bacterium]
MRIIDELKKTGYFWLPSAPEKRIPGTLIIEDGGNIELEIVGLFDESIEGINRAFNEIIKLERIIGHIEQHGLVTLDNCFYKKTNIAFGGISKSIICVNRAFIGIAYDDKEDVLFNNFQFSVEGIDEWVGISGIKVEHEEKTASITYVPPKEISLNLNNGMELLITFSWSLPGFPHQKEAKITQKTYFKLKSHQERMLNDFISAAYKINTLLCFAIDKTVCIEYVSATSDSIRKDYGDGRTFPISIQIYYAGLPYTKSKSKIDWHRMLFRFKQIEENAERIVNKWFDTYEEIDPALYLYFSTKTGAHKYLDGKFLSLAHVLETYHRRTTNDKLMDELVFKEITEKLIEQCPEENRKWLSGRLMYGNEVSLRNRIKKIIEPFKEILGSNEERNKLIRDIVNTRNYLTHYDNSLESVAVKGRNLLMLCFKMEAIFQLHLLQMLGFTELEIKSVCENSYELKQKFKDI